MQAEWNQLVNELESVIDNTQYGSGNNLFAPGGLLDQDITFQIGTTTNETLTINIASSLEDVRDTIADLKTLDLGAAPVGDLDGYTNYADASAGGWEASVEQALAGGWEPVDPEEADTEWAALVAAGGAAFEAANEAAFDVALAEVQEPSGAAQAMDMVDALINGRAEEVDDQGAVVLEAREGIGAIRSELGANINRLDHTIVNLGNMAENTEMAKGRIMDTDYAVESSNMMKNQMLTQMSMSMLSQANGMSGMVMSLVG
ncbi:hypothetical protein KUW02_26260 [Photobacterium rosenbergii]|nr:hypothetical protein [Photobacterium rosenbergii]